MGMLPDEFAARYRKLAGKCFLISQRFADSAEKLMLLDMAQAWLALAEQVEKNELLFAIFETPATPDDPKDK